jgi:hypothetical protein
VWGHTGLLLLPVFVLWFFIFNKNNKNIAKKV